MQCYCNHKHRMLSVIRGENITCVMREHRAAGEGDDGVSRCVKLRLVVLMEAAGEGAANRGRGEHGVGLGRRTRARIQLRRRRRSKRYTPRLQICVQRYCVQRREWRRRSRGRLQMMRWSFFADGGMIPSRAPRSVGSPRSRGCAGRVVPIGGGPDRNAALAGVRAASF